MRNRSQPPVQMVFTAALKQELPLEWLSTLGMEVQSLKALKAGSWNVSSESSRDKKSLLFIITGVGVSAARETALWIRENINPLFVVNIGTVGAVDSRTALGEWVMPESVCNERGEALSLDSRIPFPWPESVLLHAGGDLLTVKKPKFGDLPPDWTRFECLDMECFPQAKVFAGTDISFHSIKWVSDFSDARGEKKYVKSLPYFRQELKRVLAFLEVDKEPEISVIIPVFNRKNLIGSSVESVLNQSLPAKEIIVVDDGSDDGTLKALKPFKDRVNIVSCQKNRGVSSARNLGFEKSSSPLICFLDSDDLWQRDKLKKQWEFSQAHPFYEIMQCDEIWIRNGRRVNPCKHHEKPQGWIWKRSLDRCLVSPSAVMLKRTLLEKVGGFDEGLPACEDYDMWLRISRDHVVGLDPTLSVIKHGGHDDQLSVRYPAMDSFRVKALLKALGNEKDPWYRKELILVLKQKLAILIQGSKKRMKFEISREYEAIMSSL